MFSLTPFGGISLVAHIVINMIAICYRNIRSAFYFLFPNLETRTFKAVSKPSFLDRVLASGIVLGMFALFLGSAMSILNMPINPNLDALAVVPKMSTMNVVFYRNDAVVATTTQKNVSQSEAEDFPRVFESDSNSITDVLDELHINNSFETRANIASELRIVHEPSEYLGTAEQNELLLKAFKNLFGPTLFPLTTVIETTTISFSPRHSI